MNQEMQQCIAKNLKYLRSYHGYTQEHLADLLHISRGAYAMVENGYRVPRTDMLVRLAQIYHIGTNLFFETDPQVFQRKITLLKEKDGQLSALIELYYELSPFSQGCLFEKAAALLQAEMHDQNKKK